MKKVFIILLVVSPILFAFSTIETDTWKKYKSIDGVDIFSKVEDLSINGKVQQMLIFKYVNTNNYDVDLSWRLDLYYNGVCRSCSLPSPNEYELNLKLKKGETQAGTSKSQDKKWAVFYGSKSENIAPLDRFEFSKLNVIKK